MKVSPLGAAIAMTLCAASASAANWDDRVQVRGYGTLGVVHSDEDQADYVAIADVQPKGAGYSSSWSMNVDSKQALQVDVKFSERLSATVQLLSEGVSNNSWDGDRNEDFVPSLEWANLSYKVSDELTVRAGRIVLPLMMGAEYRKVGFAQHWIRPPVEVYGLVPFASSDGLDASYRSGVGGGVNTVRAYFGGQDTRSIPFDCHTDGWGVNDTFEKGPLTLRAAFMYFKWRSPGVLYQPLFDAFADLAEQEPGGQAAADQARRFLPVYDGTFEQRIVMYDAGVSYDPGRWFLMGEVVHMDSDEQVLTQTSGYVTAGYRRNALTPYATYVRGKTKTRDGQSVSLDGLSPDVAALGAEVNAIVGWFGTGNMSQQTFSLGVRWDFRSSFTLKAQLDHIDMDEGSRGWLNNLQPGFQPGGSLNVVSFALDYVF